MQQELIQHPVDIDYSVMKDFNDERFNGDNYYTWYAQNPYWVLANNKNNYQDDRIYGKLELSYEVIPGLKAVGRLGGDFTNARQKLRTAKLTYADNSYSSIGGKSEEKGTYTERTDNYDQIDATLFLSANYNIGTDITLGGTAGSTGHSWSSRLIWRNCCSGDQINHLVMKIMLLSCIKNNRMNI